MTSLPAPLNPFGQYLSLVGRGVNLGSLWIGDENTDPESNPKQVYWDTLATVPAEQPLSVVGGYVYRDGAPAPYYVSGAFSVRLRDKSPTNDPADGPLVFYLPSVPNLADLATPGPWPLPLAWTQPTDTSPAASAWLGGFVTPWAIQLPADLFNADGWSFTAPDGDYTITLRLNSTDEDASTGTAVATLTTADGDNRPTGATTGGVTQNIPANSRLDWYGDADDTTGINGMEWTVIAYVQGDGTGAYAGLVTQAELTAAVASLQSQIDTLTTSIANIQGYDIGDVKWFAGPAANLPSGWYALDSASVVILNISAYPALYAKIGTAWGGDGMTTFGIPPANRYPRMALSGTHAVGTLLDNSLESHNHADGASFTTGSPRPGAFGDTSNATGGSFPSGATVHTDANTGTRLLYTSTGSPAAGSGSGAEAGNFDTETRPDTAVFQAAIWTGVP